MARPNSITLSKKEQSSVLSLFKKDTKNARAIADVLSVPRYQVMSFLESKNLASYSEGSYN
jgi:sugar-specific transcriptional regulator TrmB